MHAHIYINKYRAAGSSVLCLHFICTGSLACDITVMDGNERFSMATLDFPAMSPKWAATSSAFHLNRALM